MNATNNQPPKWSKITSHQKWKEAPPKTRAKVRDAYFQDFVEPNLSIDQAPSAYAEFLSRTRNDMQPPEQPGLLDRAWGAVSDAAGAAGGAIGGLLEGEEKDTRPPTERAEPLWQSAKKAAEDAGRPVMKWTDITGQPDFQQSDWEVRQAARARYFNDVVRPNAPQNAISEARDEFFNRTEADVFGRNGETPAAAGERSARLAPGNIAPRMESRQQPSDPPELLRAPDNAPRKARDPEERNDGSGIMGRAAQGALNRGTDLLGSLPKIAGAAIEGTEKKLDETFGRGGGVIWGTLEEMEGRGYEPDFSIGNFGIDFTSDANPEDTSLALGKLGEVIQATGTDPEFQFTIDRFWKEPTPKNAIGMAAEQGPAALVDMGAMLINLPLYTAARTQEIAEERAGNQNRQFDDISPELREALRDNFTDGTPIPDGLKQEMQRLEKDARPNANDYAVAAPAAAAVAAMDRLGFDKWFPGGNRAITNLRQLPAAIGRGMGIEGFTEAIQEGGIEYGAATVGTDTGWSPEGAAKAGTAGALIGAPVGGGVAGTAGAIQLQQNNQRRQAWEQAWRDQGMENPSENLPDTTIEIDGQRQAFEVNNRKIQRDAIQSARQVVAGAGGDALAQTMAGQQAEQTTAPEPNQTASPADLVRRPRGDLDDTGRAARDSATDGETYTALRRAAEEAGDTEAVEALDAVSRDASAALETEILARTRGDRESIDALGSQLEDIGARYQAVMDRIAGRAQGPMQPTGEAQGEQQRQETALTEDQAQAPDTSLADEAPSNTLDEDAEPGALTPVRMPTDRIQVDREAYQFRTDVNERGVDDRMEGIKKWDDLRAGELVLHEREDGSLFVADGHHRLDLARRMGQPGVNAFVLREADGYSVEDARRLAAERNIASGSSTAIDAAKVFRNTEGDPANVIDERDLPRRSQIVRDGADIARLEGEAFGAVLNGVVNEKAGAAIGRAFDSAEQQLAAIDVFQKVKPENDTQRAFLINDIRQAGFSESQSDQMGMFGDDPSQSLIGERVKVMDALHKNLKGSRRLFKTLDDNAPTAEQAGNRIDVEANRQQSDLSGRALDLLNRVTTNPAMNQQINDAARRVKDGQPVAQAARELREVLLRDSESETTQQPSAPDAGRGQVERTDRREPAPDAARAADAGEQRLAGEPAGEGSAEGRLTYRSNGRPFTTQPEAMASGVSRRAQAQGQQVEAVPVEGGFAVRTRDEPTPQDTDAPQDTTSPVQSADTQLRANGQPFATETSALSSGIARRAQAQGTPVSAVPVDGGFGVRVGEQQDTQPAPEAVDIAQDDTQTDDFLETQTEESLAARDRETQQAKQADADRRREQEQRAQADAEVDDFTLAGSDRQADVLSSGGQQSLMEPGADQLPGPSSIREDGQYVGTPSRVQGGERSDGVSEPRGQRSRSRQNERQPDLLDPANLPAVPESATPAQKADSQRAARTQLSSDFRLHYEMQDVGTIPVGLSRASSPQDAAHFFAPMRKHGQETMMALVTDSDDNVLGLVRHTKGGTAESAVFVDSLITSMTMFPGASKVWLGHNHPSGSPAPSDADYKITGRIVKAMDASGIDFQGHVIAVAGGRFVSFGTDAASGQKFEPIKATPANRQDTIGLSEKVLRRRRDGDFVPPQASSPENAKRIVMDHLDGQQGLVMLDNQHYLIGVLPMTDVEMSSLREDGRARRVMEALGHSNASAVISVGRSVDAHKNMSGFINNLSPDGKLRHLDGFILQVDGKEPISLANKGVIPTRDDAFFSLSEEGPPASPARADDITAALEGIEELGDARVIQSVTDLPPQALVGMMLRGVNPADVRGMYIGGDLYVVADNVDSTADGVRAAVHEAVGHKGVRGVLGDDLVPVMRQVYRTLPLDPRGRETLDEVLRDYPFLDQNNPDHQVMIAEEMIAHLTEKGWTPGPVRRAIAKIRELLRRLFPSMRWTDADVMALSERSREYLRRQQAEVDGVSESDTDSDTRYSLRDSTNFAMPDERLRDTALRKMADKMRPVNRLQKSIRDAGGRVSEDNDVYLAEELFHGKTEQDLKQLERRYVTRLANALAKKDITQAELDQYVYARHAPERNEVIAERNPDNEALQDGGSGMTNARAAEIMESFEQEGKAEKLASLAKIVDEMLAWRREAMLDGGLVDDGTMDAWSSRYAHYVPLKGWAHDEDVPVGKDGISRPKTGQGFETKGKESKLAMGRTSEAASPTTQAIIDTTEALIRRRKNEVGQSLLSLVADNPNPDLWQVYTRENPDTERQPVVRTDPETGQKRTEIVERASSMQGPEYFQTKKNGRTYFIKMNDQRLMNAMRNVGPESNNIIIQRLGSVTRVMASLATSFNPEFMVTNFSRDIQTALLNLSAEQTRADGKVLGRKIVRQTLKDVPSAMRASYRGLSDKPSREGAEGEWDQYFQEFIADGAKTGYFDMKDLTAQAKEIERLMTTAKGGVKGNMLKGRKAAADLVENVNGAVENGVRLSAYVNARKAGVSRKRAASLAKNMTVNFNRRGESGTAFNAFYMFFNASVQGTANFARTMGGLNPPLPGKSRHNYWSRLNAGQKMGVGMVTGAFMLSAFNRMISDEDDDGVLFWDKVPAHVKERNMVLMTGGEDYIKLPLPYGYNVFSAIGTNLELAMMGPKKNTDVAKDLVLAAMGSFNPLGLEESEELQNTIGKNLSPTVSRSVVQLIANEDWSGRPVYQDDFGYSVPTPDSSRAFRTTPEAYKNLASMLNEMTGGSEFKSGKIDITPDTIQHFVNFYGSGAWGFMEKTADAANRVVQGDEIERYRVPFSGRVLGSVPDYEDEGRFYDRYNALGQTVNEIEGLTGQERAETVRNNPRARQMFKQAKDVRQYLKETREKRDKVKANDRIPEPRRKGLVKMYEENMDDRIDAFNKRYNELIGE